MLTTSYPLAEESLSGSFLRDLLEGLGEFGWSFDGVAPAGAGSHAARALEPGDATRAASRRDGAGAGDAAHDGARAVRVHAVRYPGYRLGGGLAHARGMPETLSSRPLAWSLVPGLVASLHRAADAWLHRGRFDLVWSHWLLPSGAVGAALARRRNTPHVVTAHGGDVHLLERFARAHAAREVFARLWSRSVLTAPADHTAARVAAATGGAPVAVAPLPALAAPAGAPEPGPLRLLFLGRFEPIKGPDILLEALSGVPPSSVDEVTIAGAGSLAPRLEQLADGVPARVRFPGVLGAREKALALARAHALVVPSRAVRGRAEGFPHAAAEALAAGRPVLAAREGALGGLLERTGAGIVFDAGGDAARTAGLAAAIARVADRDERERLRDRALPAGTPFRRDAALARWDELLRAAAAARAA